MPTNELMTFWRYAKTILQQRKLANLFSPAEPYFPISSSAPPPVCQSPLLYYKSLLKPAAHGSRGWCESRSCAHRVISQLSSPHPVLLVEMQRSHLHPESVSGVSLLEPAVKPGTHRH